MSAELVRSGRLFSGAPYAYAATAPETVSEPTPTVSADGVTVDVRA